jgi:hypothetical protein
VVQEIKINFCADNISRSYWLLSGTALSKGSSFAVALSKD